MHIGLVDGATTRELRRRVLRPNLAVDDPLPGDELHEDVLHIGAVDEDGSVLSTCFPHRETCPWLPDVHPAWHLRQLATAPAVRRRGLGGGVLREALDQVRARGGRLVWCNARLPAVPLYRRWGFQPHGEIFTDSRHPVPHRRVHRELLRYPGSSDQ